MGHLHEEIHNYTAVYKDTILYWSPMGNFFSQPVRMNEAVEGETAGSEVETRGLVNNTKRAEANLRPLCF